MTFSVLKKYSQFTQKLFGFTIEYSNVAQIVSRLDNNNNIHGTKILIAFWNTKMSSVYNVSNYI